MRSILGGIAGALLLLLSQGAGYKSGQVLSVVDTVPPSCTGSLGEIILLRGNAPKLYVCSASDTFTQIGWASSGVVSGSILLVDTGTCPSTYTEVSSLSGKTLLGTIASNADVGGTGGSDNITPAGTNSTSTVTPLGSNSALTFTGSAWSAPAVSWPAGVPTNGSIAIGTFVNSATATTGNCAATNIAAGTGSTTACKATAPNLTVPAQGHSGTLTSPTISWPAGVPTLATYTPTGTINTPTFTGSSSTVSAQTFTGTQFDNRSAYKKVIFCKKD